jgi:hypothetical protein
VLWPHCAQFLKFKFNLRGGALVGIVLPSRRQRARVPKSCPALLWQRCLQQFGVVKRPCWLGGGGGAFLQVFLLACVLLGWLHAVQTAVVREAGRAAAGVVVAAEPPLPGAWHLAALTAAGCGGEPPRRFLACIGSQCLRHRVHGASIGGGVGGGSRGDGSKEDDSLERFLGGQVMISVLLLFLAAHAASCPGFPSGQILPGWAAPVLSAPALPASVLLGTLAVRRCRRCLRRLTTRAACSAVPFEQSCCCLA